jgi:hypothetical protein
MPTVQVQKIMGDAVPMVSQKIDLPELQGTPEDVSREKCKLAAKEVDGPVCMRVFVCARSSHDSGRLHKVRGATACVDGHLPGGTKDVRHCNPASILMMPTPRRRRIRTHHIAATGALTLDSRSSSRTRRCASTLSTASLAVWKSPTSYTLHPKPCTAVLAVRTRANTA